MARTKTNARIRKRYYLPTKELYKFSSGYNITPAHNNIYDVWIDFNTGRSRQPSLKTFINQHGFFGDTNNDPGDYLALFCSEAVLPGSQIQTSQVDGLRQGVSSNYAVYRRYPDVQLTFYSQQDYYTNDVFNAWMEYISPTYIQNGTHGETVYKRLENTASYRKLRYPNEYKCPIQITAFSSEIYEDIVRLSANNEDVSMQPSSITYHLVNAFPVNIVSAPLAYGDAELVKTSIQFKYDYYYIERTSTYTNTDGQAILKESEAVPKNPIPQPR